MRSKRQALMFLMGATLVGGVLGFSADRMVITQKARKQQRERLERPSWFDVYGFTPEQRMKWDAILDSLPCKIAEVMEPVQPRVDSIRRSLYAQAESVLRPEQLQKLEAARARQDSLRANRARGGSPRGSSVKGGGDRSGAKQGPRPPGPSFGMPRMSRAGDCNRQPSKEHSRP
jgi:hypothetical protein